MKTCVIFNPAAKGQKAERLRARLDAITRHAVLKKTTAPNDARRRAAEAIAEGCDTIVAAGGDGTINEVLNGIGDAAAFDRVRLGVLPLGTVNVFAKELKIPSHPGRAWGKSRRICKAGQPSAPIIPTTAALALPHQCRSMQTGVFIAQFSCPEFGSLPDMKIYDRFIIFLVG